MVEMQRLTLAFYDENWQKFGWGSGKSGSAEEYQKWRKMTEDEITGRWGPVSYMVAIVMRRQAGSVQIPEWEEAAATACAVQNMHLQASAQPGLACYWSSWHDAARDSSQMREYLNMGEKDKCYGFFIISSCHNDTLARRRFRSREKHLSGTEWRE